MQNITTIIFDFDSTLAHSLPEIKKIFLSIAHDLRYSVTPKLVESLIHEEIKEIFKKLNLSFWQLPKVEKLFRLKMKTSIKNIKPFPETKEMIIELEKLGFQLGIFTSNTPENVEWFLKKYHLEKYFDFIDGGSSFLGKARKLKKLLRNKRLKREEVFYVGDETRDITAAQKNKVKVIAVTWGINPRPVLSKYNPDYLVDNQQQIISIFKKLC